VSGYTYDAGALIAAERNDRSMWAIHLSIHRLGMKPTVPSAVLAQVWRGGPQVQLSRLLANCTVEPLSESQARAVGALLAKSMTTDVVDASVVVIAASRRDVVITSDPEDIRELSSSLGIRLDIRDV
jgi:hypothetical protein